MKVHEFETLVQKLDLRTRDSKDRLAWFEHGGRVIARTKRSHGKGDLPGHLIRQQLRLNEDELAGIVGCSLLREDYVTILTKKGLIEKQSPSANSTKTPEKQSPSARSTKRPARARGKGRKST